MKNYLLFPILLLFALFSCDNSNDFTNEEELSPSQFVKTVDGEIVEQIPSDVYNKLSEDLDKQNKVESLKLLRSSYYNNGDCFVLKEELKKLSKKTPKTRSSGTFSYRAHLRSYGWTGYVPLGQIAGTTGQKMQMEALSFAYPIYTPAFRVRAHVEYSGWLPWVGIGDDAGTVGQNKRIEAIQIDVNPSFATNVYYKVHMQDYGWGPLVSNGEVAGMTGAHKRMEAFVLYMYIL